MERTWDRSLLGEVAVITAASVYVVAVVALTWYMSILTTCLLAAGLGALFLRWHRKSDFAVAVSAAALGFTAEAICIHYGVWTYTNQDVLGLPMWIGLVWAFLFVLFRRMAGMVLYCLSADVSPRLAKLRKPIFTILTVIIIVYFIFTELHIKRSIAITYFVFMFIAVCFWHTERDLLIFVVAGIFGTLGEYFCMQLGFWEYHYPLLRSIGLPISLPLAWGLSGVIIARIAWIWTRNEDPESPSHMMSFRLV